VLVIKYLTVYNIIIKRYINRTLYRRKKIISDF